MSGGQAAEFMTNDAGHHGVPKVVPSGLYGNLTKEG